MISLIIPTYNEKECITRLLKEIFEAFRKGDIEGEVIIVDDNSPDGTAKIAQKLEKDYNLRILVRDCKRGLSSAVLDGFRVAKGEIMGVIDADLSHSPQSIPSLIKPLEKDEADLVIASRYVKGGGIENWPLRRRIISSGAKVLARPLTKVKDPLSGYFFFKRRVIEEVQLNPKGYKIGLEIVVKGKYKNLLEVPYVFRGRVCGKSKLGIGEYKNYLFHLLRLYFYKGSLAKQFFKFCLVGGLGVLVNLGVLYSLVQFLGLFYLYAAILAFVVAVSSNFILNRIWTFANVRKGVGITGQYFRFFGISIMGLLINLTILYLLVQHGNLWYLFSQMVAILAATTNNFLGSKYWAFRKKGLDI